MDLESEKMGDQTSETGRLERCFWVRNQGVRLWIGVSETNGLGPVQGFIWLCGIFKWRYL